MNAFDNVNITILHQIWDARWRDSWVEQRIFYWPSVGGLDQIRQPCSIFIELTDKAFVQIQQIKVYPVVANPWGSDGIIQVLTDMYVCKFLYQWLWESYFTTQKLNQCCVYLITGGTLTDPDAEPGARLMCHLLLRLFRASDDSTAVFESTTGSHIVKSSCNQHLLAAAHSSISVEALLGVLKAILLLGKKPTLPPSPYTTPFWCHCFMNVNDEITKCFSKQKNLPKKKKNHVVPM